MDKNWPWIAENSLLYLRFKNRKNRTYIILLILLNLVYTSCDDENICQLLIQQNKIIIVDYKFIINRYWKHNDRLILILQRGEIKTVQIWCY